MNIIKNTKTTIQTIFQAFTGLYFHIWTAFKHLTIRRIILFAFIGTFLIPLFSARLTYADPVKTGSALIGSYTPTQVAESASFYAVLSQCVSHNMKPDIKLSIADDGDPGTAAWFDNGSFTNAGAYGTVWPKGKQDCKDFANEAIGLWGYNRKDFLTALGYTYNADPSILTWHGTADSNTRMNNFKAAVGLRVYGSMVADPTLTDAAKYELYMSGIAAEPCKAVDLGISPVSNATVNNLASQNKSISASESKAIAGVDTGLVTYKILPIVIADGSKTENHVYAYVSSFSGSQTANTPPTDTGVTLYGYQSSGTGSNTKSCTEMANALPGLAAPWITWAEANPGKGTPPTGAAIVQVGPNDKDTKSCTIEGIGWIICPVMTFMGGITDGAYSVVSDLLKTPPLSTTLDAKSNPTYGAWAIMRNFANIAFIIAILIIIYSQLTSVGLTNYGIKKLLPRIIVAAILVNVSYWICAIAVDASNILGGSLKGVIDNITANYQMPPGTGPLSDAFNGSSVWTNIVGLVITGGIGVTVLMVYPAIVLPLLIAALAAIVTVLIVLTLRQALIILLIVIAPLAFVAYLLPNTEGLFKKWMGLLKILLLMYPIIAVIFGVSAFAGKVVMASANGNTFVQIMGAGVMVIPLFITPVIMRTAGGVLNRVAGVVNNPNKGVFDRMRKGASEVQQNSSYMRGRTGRKAIRSSRKNSQFASQYELGRKIATGEEELKGSNTLETAKRAAAVRAYHASRGGSAVIGDLAAYAKNSNNANLQQLGELASKGLTKASGYVPGATGKVSDLSELSEHYKAQVEKASEEGLRDAMRSFGSDLVKWKATNPGGDADDFMLRRASSMDHTPTERSAALNEAARQGRDQVLRNYSNAATTDGEREVVQQAISANVASLIGKAPDLVKGAEAAFGDISADDLTKFSTDTASAYMSHLDTLRTSAAPSDAVKYQKAIQAFKVGVQKIQASPELQGNFKVGVNTKLTGSASAGVAADLQTQFAALGSMIQT